MKRQSIIARKRLLCACAPLLALSFSMPVAATASPKPEPGNYCPDTVATLHAVANDLSAGLDLTMRSRSAQINGNPATAVTDLNSVGSTLSLAASHGTAARTSLLIDAIIKAKAAADYARLLTWFPLLHASLQPLGDNAAARAADDLISRAEEIMQGDQEGDPLQLLNEARHMLACDGLDIPLQEAIQARDKLISTFSEHTKANAYDPLLKALHGALAYTLKSNEP